MNNHIKSLSFLVILCASLPIYSIANDNKEYVAREQLAAQQQWEDAMITARLKEEFIAEKVFGIDDLNSLKIIVTTEHGTVYLSGEVENSLQFMRAISLAKQIPAVRHVVNRMKINSSV